jgi:MoaA/NifB/PqqE/SkfB family radical SAM enzyme
MEKLKEHYKEIKCCVDNNIVKILSAQINLLNRCYQHCVGCRKYEWPDNELDINRAIEIINELKIAGCQSIVLSGGEPLMYKNIDKLIQSIRHHDMNIGILTSGLYPDSLEKLNYVHNEILSSLDVIVKYSDYIAFSYDGATNETFKKCRGVDCSELVLKNINKMIAIKDKYNSKIKFKMNMTVSNINYKEMAGVLKIAQENNMNECNFFPIHTWNDLKLNNIDKIDIINQIKEVMIIETQGNVKTNIQVFLETINRNKPSTCIIPFIHCVIDSDGSVFSCCRLLDDNGDYNNRNKNIILGNINKSKINEIFDNGKDIIKRLYYANEKVCWSCDRYNKLNEQYFEWMIDNNKKVFL